MAPASQAPSSSFNVLYSPVGLGIFCLVVALLAFVSRERWLLGILCLLAFISRERWLPLLSLKWHHAFFSRSSANESTSFLSDFENGFSSSNFDLTGNVADDSRTGLDPKAKGEISALMSKNSALSFDEARALYIKRKMLQSNINEDGTPNDPKAFFFS